MHIYAVISLLFVILFLIEQKSNNQQLRNRLFYFASFIAVGLLAFRGTDVGGDTISYCGYFTGRGGMYGTFESNDTFEWGFRSICQLLMVVSRSEFWFLFATSIITMAPFIYLIKRDCKKSRMLPLCLYMLVWEILSVTQTAIRQDLATSCLLFAYIVWTTHFEKERMKYVLIAALLLLGFFTHNSILVGLPLVLVVLFIPFNKKTALATVLGSFIVVMFAKSLFSDVFDMFNAYMIGFEAAEHMLNTYYENARYALDSEISFNRLGPATLLVSLIVWMSNEEDMKSPYLKFIVMGAAFYNIGASFPLIFRVVFPLLFLGIIFVPSELDNKKNVIAKVIVILLMFFFIRNQVVYMKPGTDDRMLPYTFIWDEI